MDYVIAFILSALEILLIGFYFEKLNIFSKDCVEDDTVTQPLVKLCTKAHFYVVMGIIAVALFGSSFILTNNVSNIPNLVKLLLLMGVLAAAAVIDLKKTIIPNFLIVFGLIARVLIYVIELLFYNNIFVHQLISDVIGFVVGFGILFIVSVVSKGALGFGDVKLFGLIGLMSGAICTYSTLILCLISSTIVSIGLMIAKKRSRKDSIPFGPFIFVGYVIAIILTCY